MQRLSLKAELDRAPMDLRRFEHSGWRETVRSWNGQIHFVEIGTGPWRRITLLTFLPTVRAYLGIAMMLHGLLLLSICDQDPVIETVGMSL